jgi:membrane associated rhomboid family serine protease
MLNNLPRATRYLLIINLVMWLLDESLQRYGVQLTALLGLHYWSSPGIHVWQPVTYMFMHGGFRHLFFNMFALLMFGPVLEREWGERKYLIYYFVCGLGAALVQEVVWSVQLHALLGQYSELQVASLASQMVTIGASGAVFGILFAFGWLFPDVPMFLFFIPIPIRARTMVIIYALIELAEGFSSIPGDNVAHFAHLGGMLFGWLLLYYWRNGRSLSALFSRFTRKHSSSIDNESKSKFSDYHYQRRVDE